jgi:hypothetical protein
VICVPVTEHVQGAMVGLRVGVIVDGSTSSGEAVAVGPAATTTATPRAAAAVNASVLMSVFLVRVRDTSSRRRR